MKGVINIAQMDYQPDNNSRRRQIDFNQTVPPRQPRPSGLRDEDWADDEFTTPAGYSAPRREPYNPSQPPRYTQAYDEPYRQGRYTYAESNRPRGGHERPDNDDYNYYNDRMEPDNKPKGFFKRHAILLNIIYIILAAVAFGWIAMLFLDYWTFHGQERIVPDAKNQAVAVATSNIRSAGLKAVVTDSIFDSYAPPGTVVEQTPIPGARIKKGGSVYLTIVSFSPKMVTVPDFYNVSERQAKSLFEGLGLPPVATQVVPSEYEGLVLGARYNGVALSPGARIPVSARVTLEVGSGLEVLEEETGAPIDSIAIDEAIEHLDIQ